MCAWLWYSLDQHLWVSGVSCAVYLPYSVALLSICLARQGTRDSLSPFYVLLSAVTLAYVLGGPTALAVVLGTAPLAEIPQIRGVIRSDAPALSSLAYGLVVLRTLPWLPYALQHSDLAITLWVATCTAVNITMCMVLVSKRGVQTRGVSGPRTPR
jgi:hypothetical protein